MKDINVTPETTKSLEENVGKKLHNTGFVNDFKKPRQQNQKYTGGTH